MAAPQKLIKLEGVVVDSKGGVLPGVTVVGERYHDRGGNGY